ncbi:MAG: CinA family protein [Clostridia bacterium]|nr:CinA family protein [Clostridia bacterium]
MIEEYKDYCVLKAFNLSAKQIDDINALSTKGVFIQASQEFLDDTIIVINKSESEVVFQNTLNKINEIAKDKIYADYDTTLEECVVKMATEKNLKIAVAESLTGGMLCSRIVNVSGASAVLYEGFVTYSSSSKVRRLHVKSTTIDSYGAISKETCQEMVQGLLANKEIQVAVATTGCAGPNRDENGTEVGTVFVGVGCHNGDKEEEFHLDGNRETIRKTTTNIALYMLMNVVKNACK